MIDPWAGVPRSVTVYEDARAEVIRRLVVWLATVCPPSKPTEPAAWFERYGDEYAARVVAAQLEAAVLADWSVDAALAWQGKPVDPGAPQINVAALAGTDGAGRPVLGQAYASMGKVEGQVAAAVDAGEPHAVALARAWHAAASSLAQASQTMVSDVSRTTKTMGTLTRNVEWVRMLVPPSCSRCVVLAGRRGNWNVGFQRHPGCDCTVMPCDPDNPEVQGLFWDPQDYFDSLTAEQQDKTFTKAGAQAIRDGADVGQVVNARRGMFTANDRFGVRTRMTREGTTKRGWASPYLRSRYKAKMVKRGGRYTVTSRPRLMPEEIYKMADGDRDIALNLLHKNGYLTDASPTLSGRLPGIFPRDAEVQAAYERAIEKIKTRTPAR